MSTDPANECLYDYKQAPAVTAGCNESNHFEWFWFYFAAGLLQ
jgi:hypothetical protein